MKRLLILLSLVSPCFGQALPYTPTPYAAYISADGTTWNAWTSAGGFGSLAYTPVPIGLYCQASANVPWTPCTPSSSTGTITSLTASDPIVATPTPITTTGTFSCPSCVTLTGTQTVTNKTVSGPTITATSATGGFNGVIYTPASSSATCITGTVAWDASFIYICTSTNVFKRAAIVSF